MEKKEIDILDILLILVKHKKFLIVSLLIIAVLVVTYSLIVTQTWTSTVTFKPLLTNNLEMGMFGSLMSGNLSSVFSSSSGNSEITELISSRSIIEKIIEEFNLISFFKIVEEDSYIEREQALKMFRENVLTIDRNIETEIVTIQITTKDRILSAKIANHMVDELEDYLQNVRMTKGREEREFLKKRIEQINIELEDLSSELTAFKKKHNVIDFESQLAPALASYANLISRYLEEEIKLEISNEFYNNNPAEEEILRYRKDELLKQIKQLESGENSIINYQLPLDDVPELSQKYALLITKISILKKVHETIYPQHEMAKLQELRDTQTINIIDRAVPAGNRTFPRRGFLCVVVFIISAFGLSMLVIVTDLWQNRLARDEQTRLKYEEFKNLLWKRNK